MSKQKVVYLFLLIPLFIFGAFRLSSDLSADSHETLIIQLREVKLNNFREGLLDEKDLETKWAMIVVHDDGLTTEIEYPGNTFVPAQAGDVIDFGTRVGHPQDLSDDLDELTIFFVGVDLDDESLEDFEEYTLPVYDENFSSDSPATSAIGTLISLGISAEKRWTEYDWKKVAKATAEQIQLGLPSFLRRASDYAPETLAALASGIGSPIVGGAVGFAVDVGVDETVNFFAQHDEIDSAAIILKREENWNEGVQTVTSSNGSLEFTYEVTRVVDAQLEVTNSTLFHLCGVYVTQGETVSNNLGYIDDTSNKLDHQTLPPGESTVFNLAATGEYSNQIYDCYGQLSGESVRSVEENNEINWINPKTYFAVTNKTSEDICFVKYQDASSDEVVFLEDMLHYAKLPPQHSVVMSNFIEVDRYRFDIETCDGTSADILVASRSLLENSATHWNILDTNFSNEKHLLFLRNEIGSDICDLSITEEESGKVYLPLDNEFTERTLEQDAQEILRLEKGNYSIVAQTCDEDSLSYSVNLEENTLFPLE